MALGHLDWGRARLAVAIERVADALLVEEAQQRIASASRDFTVVMDPFHPVPPAETSFKNCVGCYPESYPDRTFAKVDRQVQRLRY
jgi:hypothetical protein